VRDFSVLVFSITALVLGALLLFQEAHRPDSVPISEQRFTTVFSREVDEPLPTPTATPPPTPQPTPKPSDAPVARLRIPKIGVDAHIVQLGIDAQGYMEVPQEPLDIGWYGFTAHPSFEGNAVFAGHVDSARIGPAIFWNLRRVVVGDEIDVALSDGTTYTYRVISAESFSSREAPVEEIIGPTERDSITLITCDGVFNTRTHEYDRRLVVRAEKITDKG
jgi:LPXTG-site transpeptidase (sortase) family protein